MWSWFMIIAPVEHTCECMDNPHNRWISSSKIFKGLDGSIREYGFSIRNKSITVINSWNLWKPRNSMETPSDIWTTESSSSSAGLSTTVQILEKTIIGSWHKPSPWRSKHCIVFIHFYSASLSMSHSEEVPTTGLILCRSKYTEAVRTTASEGLAQGPYVAAKVGFEPATLQTEGTEPHHWATMPTLICPFHISLRWDPRRRQDVLSQIH